MSSQLFDQAAIRSNQSGKITRDQRDALKSKVSSIPGVLTLIIFAGLFALVYVTLGKVLMASTALGIGAIVIILILTTIISSLLGNLVGAGRMGGLAVEPSPGQVVWKRNQYIAESNGRVLEPILGSARDLQPGDYTFYVLRGKNWILSAQPASAARQSSAPMSYEQMRAIIDKPLDFDPKQSPEKAAARMAELQQVGVQFESMDPSRVSAADVDRFRQAAQAMGPQMMALVGGQIAGGNMRAVGQALDRSSLPAMDAHGLDELRHALAQTGLLNTAALDANRSGSITGDQRAGLMKTLWMNVLIGILALAIGVLVGGGAALERNWMVALAGGGFGLLVAVALLYQARLDLADWAGGQARMVEGIVSKYTHTNHETSSTRNPTTYYLEIHKQRFSVSRAAYESLLEGRTYRVYMTPGAKKLLNVEPA